MFKDRKITKTKITNTDSSKQSKYYYKSLPEALEYLQSDELVPNELEEKPLNSFFSKRDTKYKKRN